MRDPCTPTILLPLQAIEAKEGATIQNETVTLASVSYQNFFRAYPVLSGMSGTAATEIDEFSNIYDMSVQARTHAPWPVSSGIYCQASL